MYQFIIWIVGPPRDWKALGSLNKVSSYSTRSPLPQQTLRCLRNGAFCTFECSEKRSKANLDYSKICICLPLETSTIHMKSLSTERYLHSTRMVRKCIAIEIIVSEYIQECFTIGSSVDCTDNDNDLECRNYNFLQLCSCHFKYFSLYSSSKIYKKHPKNQTESLSRFSTDEVL